MIGGLLDLEIDENFKLGMNIIFGIPYSIFYATGSLKLDLKNYLKHPQRIDP